MIGSFHVDLAVCSCKGIDMEMGVTDSNEKDAQIKKAFMRAAKKRVLAVDSTKFDKISFMQIAELSDIDLIVTDAEPNEQWKRHLESEQVELMY